jgi:hypothetical protein
MPTEQHKIPFQTNRLPIQPTEADPANLRGQPDGETFHNLLTIERRNQKFRIPNSSSAASKASGERNSA